MGTMISLLLAVVSTAWAADAPAPKSEIDAKKIYAAKCATCHGKEGKGNPVMAKMFRAKPEAMDWTSEVNVKLTDAALEKTITGGNGKMPAFKPKLKPEEIKAMVAYVRSLQPAADKPSEKASGKPAAQAEAPKN